jgi:glycosyltransferase involved in cell wall biosynthesis
VLVGVPDNHNPQAVPEDTLKQWHAERILEWWGERHNMPEVFAASNVVVLPSYREGVPRSLMEAAACGRAIIATDVPGCREIARDGENALLVPPRDAPALARAIRALAENAPRRAEMGARGRAIAVSDFSAKVLEEILGIYRQLLGLSGPGAER